MTTTQKAKDELQKLVKLFESGEAPKALATVTLISPDMPSYKWTLSNRLMAFYQCLETDCRGFKQWQAVNRWVKKGASAVYILRPHSIKEIDEKTNLEVSRLVGFRCLPVFPLTETLGDHLPELKPLVPPLLLDVAKAFGVTVDYQGFIGDFLGLYRPNSEKIVLATHEERVFFHELSHAAHKQILGKLKNGQDPIQEMVAELSASVLARVYGKQYPNEGFTYDYLTACSTKLKKDLASCLMSVLGEVEKVLELIITTNQTKGGELNDPVDIAQAV